VTWVGPGYRGLLCADDPGGGGAGGTRLELFLRPRAKPSRTGTHFLGRFYVVSAKQGPGRFYVCAFRRVCEPDPAGSKLPKKNRPRRPLLARPGKRGTETQPKPSKKTDLLPKPAHHHKQGPKPRGARPRKRPPAPSGNVGITGTRRVGDPLEARRGLQI